MKTCLGLSEISQTLKGGSGSSSSRGGKSVSTASNSLLAARAVPDTSSASLNRGLTAERAQVLGVLLDLNLLALTTER